ncbi:prepilin-type N-terminal cleavage/methylation domain-containing protein [Mucilaginibacter mali]|uniref:Prepilin-type N-terminal cleavage/methylation domain-containing protein n=1 Tax=Mucilaginibacter mali TaxID=2740462 RepID=A0A7D4QL91_9SPHI|nr:prepilin-type N-terminal cleavage/methylation domain-containing protein [Mucilaginibacter mali]QKJ31050.1 prepilin-type N-terminal cleavage/methylation domain-containing protein [Mucilaginibacter mali]
MKQRAAAFTLVEMAIALLISALVIGMTYSAYTIVLHAYSIYKTKNDRLFMLTRLDELLKKDFDRSQHVFFADNAVICDYGAEQAVYHFRDSMVVRVKGIADSFKLSHTPVIALFEKQEAGFASNAPSNLVDDLSFSVKSEKDTVVYHYHKTYSSFNLINQNPHADH